MTAACCARSAVTVLCGLALLLGAGRRSPTPGWTSSDPADGTSLADRPQRVSLTFNEPMQPGFTTMTVVGPDQAQYQAGDVTANGRHGERRRPSARPGRGATRSATGWCPRTGTRSPAASRSR